MSLEQSSQESWWRSRPLMQLRSSRVFLVGAFLVLVFIVAAVFAPQLAPPKDRCLFELAGTSNEQIHNPATSLFWKAFFPPSSCFQTPRLDFSQKPTAPTAAAPFGTSGGFDVWYGLIWGTRTAFYLSFLVVFASAAIGLLVGTISGFFGGLIDDAFMRFTDVIFAFPSLVLIIVLVSLLGRNLNNMALAFILTGWAGYARLVRSEVLKVRSLEYVEGARALGASNFTILFKHVIPNSITAFMTVVILDFGSIVLSVSGLSLLGLGTELGYADWGQFINFGRLWVSSPQYWYVLLFPGLTVVMWGLAWNLVGDALRDAFNPRSK